MGWTRTRTDNGDGTDRAVITDEAGEVIFDMDVDHEVQLSGEWRTEA